MNKKVDTCIGGG